MSVSGQTLVRVLYIRQAYLYVGSLSTSILRQPLYLIPGNMCVMRNTESVMVGLVYVTENGQTTRVVYCLTVPIELRLAVTCRFPTQ
jgi:hypothetical protein